MAHIGTPFQTETDKPLFHQAASRSQKRRERRPVDSRVHDEGTGAGQFRSPGSHPAAPSIRPSHFPKRKVSTYHRPNEGL